MKKEPDCIESSLSETMAARIKIEELGDPARQRKITDAVGALGGVIEVKIENGALHVSYDPLATTEKKIEQAVRSTGEYCQSRGHRYKDSASRPANLGERGASSS